MSKKLKQLVDQVLKENPEARADDKVLIYEVWKKVAMLRGFNLNDKTLVLLREFFPDTITRIRRKLNQEGLYLPSKEVQMYRRRAEIDTKHEYRNKPDKDNPVWTAKEGKEISLKDLNEVHLNNLAKYLWDEYQLMGSVRCEEKDQHLIKDIDNQIELIVDWMEVVTAEMDSRIKKNDVN